MKKALMLLLLGVMALGTGVAKAAPGYADATSARSQAMNADINVVEDYDLIFTFPNKVLDYKNTVDFRMADPGDTQYNWGGVLDGKYEKIGVIGVYAHRPNMATFPIMDGMSVFGYSMYGNIPQPNPLVDLFWAKNISNLGLGVQLSYADTKQDNKETYLSNSQEQKAYARQFGVRAGVGIKNLGPFQESNFAVGYLMGKVEVSDIDSTDPANNDKLEGDGIHVLDLNANVRHDLSENDNVKLFASFTTGKFGVKDAENVTPTTANHYKFSAKESNIVLGIGENHSVAEGAGLVSAGVKFQSLNYTLQNEVLYADGTVELGNGDKDKISMTAVPLFVSVEARVKSWLVLRAGTKYYAYSRMHYKHPETEVGGVDTNEGWGTYANDLSFSTGFGLLWKNWTLDTVLDTNDLEDNLSNFQPGRGVFYDGGNMLTIVKADLKYKF